MHHGRWILASVAIVMLALSLATAGERFDLSEAEDPFATPQAARVSLDHPTDRPVDRPVDRPLDQPRVPNPFEDSGAARPLTDPGTGAGTDPARQLMDVEHADHAEAAGTTPGVMPASGPLAAESNLALDVMPTPSEPDGPAPESLPLPPTARPFDVPTGGPFDEPTDIENVAGSDVGSDMESEPSVGAAAPAAADETAGLPMPPASAAADVALPTAGAQGFQVDSSFAPSPGGTGASAVTLEWVRRTEVSVGQPCQCDLLVKNTGESAVHDVQVQAYFPPTVRFLRETKPAPAARPTHLIWSLGTIPAGQTRTIELHMIPSQRGELAATAFVRCTSGSAVNLEVAEPMLQVELKGPSEVQVGDPASQIISVSNPGTGTAQNVEIRAFVPTGLEHAAGKQLALKIGSLSAGEARMVRLALAAVSGGEHVVRVVAEARRDAESEPYLRQSTETTVRVIAPSVQVAVNGPTLRYKNREATYKLQVTNDGTAHCNNVRVIHTLPDGFQFVGADNGGTHDTVGRTVSWFVGRIEPGRSVELNVTLLASALGQQVHRVAAITDQGTRAEAELATVVDGVPALVLKLADQSDPVEVGAETAYEVTVRNEGTKAAQSVAVTCELPAGVELIKTEGPTGPTSQTGTVTFTPIAALPPGEVVKYRLTVRGRQDGFQRLKAQVVSESLPEPLSAEELTRFYGQPVSQP